MHAANVNIQKRINTLAWILPLILVIAVLTYQLGVARWVHNQYGDAVHFAIEVFFFSTTGPLFTYFALSRIGTWVAEKERIQRAAEVQKRRLVSITSASADAIVGVNPQGNIETWNMGAILLFGYQPSEVEGKPFGLLFEEVSETNWLTETVGQRSFVRGYETACKNSEGAPIMVELTASSVEDEAGELFGMSIILRDITKRKQREAEIRRLNESLNRQVDERTRELGEKVEELGKANLDLLQLDQHRSELVSLVSHQIRAPLTNVRGAVERMQLDCTAMNPTCTRMLDVLEQQVNRLERLVQDVLNTTRIEAGKFAINCEPISILPVISEIVDQFQARGSHQSFFIEEKPGLPLVFADRDCTAEIVTNLLDNASKYSPPDSRISIVISGDQSALTIGVRDSGPGINDDSIGRVFDKFYRAEMGDSQQAYGFGLGLYLCRLLAEAQGGQIWAENHSKGGAVFSFSLPVWSETLA